ncbi:hypothetical protein [Streptomyces sp. NPDC047968]|uniref:hypothetical protein n=1 Tax=unclassified Streptomyces TaxID=2593676 RepID=UPI00343D4F90
MTVGRGEDARQRLARLTSRARGMLPPLDAEWQATAAAAAAFEAELSHALGELVEEAIAVLGRSPLRDRIAGIAPYLTLRRRGRPATPVRNPVGRA